MANGKYEDPFEFLDEVKAPTPSAEISTSVLRSDDPNALWNALGYSAWEFLNTSLLTVPGTIGEITGMDETLRELVGLDPTAKAARVGGAIGGALGFLAPMRVAGKIVGAPFRHFAKGGTRDLQRQAAKQMQTTLAKKGKTITDADAMNIVREQTEDMIGFTGRGFKSWIGGGPAKGMEVSDDAIRQSKLFLQDKLPSRIRGALDKTGTKISQRQAQALGDDITKMVSEKPINSISSMIINKFGPKHPFLAKAVGHSVQEAIEFSIVGTTMDFVSSFRSDRPEFDMAHSILTHGAIGGALGIVKMIPGGRSRGFVRDFFKVFGVGTRRLNKKIGGMNEHELRAMMRGRLKENHEFLRNVETKSGEIAQVSITEKTLNQLTKKEMREQLIKLNNRSLSTLRSWEGMPAQFADDFLIPSTDMAGTWARMIGGATVLNIGNFQSYAHMDKDEIIFHLALGAVMTKQGHGSRSRLMYTRPQLKQAMATLESVGLDVRKIDTIARVTDQTTELILGSSENKDVDFLISKLEEAGFIYRKYDEGGNAIPGSDAKKLKEVLQRSMDIEGKEAAGSDIENLNFLNIIEQIILPSLDYRGYRVKDKKAIMNELRDNPEYGTLLRKTISDISNKTSEMLSTPETEMKFGVDALTVARAYHTGAKIKMDKLEKVLITSYRDMVRALTGSDPYNPETGRMKKLELNTQNLSQEKQTLVEKVIHIRNKLKHLNIITESDIIFNATSVTGVKARSTTEKVFDITDVEADKMIDVLRRAELELSESLLGRRINSDMEIMRFDNDPFLWSMLSNKRHVVNISAGYDILMGRTNSIINPDSVKPLQEVISKIFSPEGDTGKIVERIPTASKKDMQEFLESLPESERINFEAEANFLLDKVWNILSIGKNKFFGKQNNNVDPRDIFNLLSQVKEIGIVGFKGVESLNKSAKIFEQIYDWGMDAALGAKKISPMNKRVMQRLIEQGIIATQSEDAGGGAKFFMTGRISEKAMNKYLSKWTGKEKEAKREEMENLFNNLKEELSEFVQFNKDFVLDEMSERQMIEIFNTAQLMGERTIYADASKFVNDGERIMRELQIELSDLDKQIKQMGTPELPSDKTELANLRKIRDQRRNMETDINNLMNIVGYGIGDRGHYHAAAFIFFAKKEGLMKLLSSIDERNQKARIDKPYTATRKIDIAIEGIVDKINRVMEKEDTVDNILAEQEGYAINKEYIEGHIPKNENNRITPETFFLENGISKDGIFLQKDNKKIFGAKDAFPVTAEDKSIMNRLMTQLYVNSKNGQDFGLILLRGIGRVRGIGWQEKYKGTNFEEKMKSFEKLEGRDRAIAFRANVTRLAQNINSRYSINRLNATILKGTEAHLQFTRSEMPEGSFTDMLKNAFGQQFGENVFLLDKSIVEDGRSKNFWEIRGDLDEALWTYDSAVTAKNASARIRRLFNLKDETIDGKEVSLPHRQLIRIPVDEHMTIVVPLSSFDSLSKSFVKWFDGNFKDHFSKDQAGEGLYKKMQAATTIENGGLQMAKKLSKGANGNRISGVLNNFLEIRQTLEAASSMKGDQIFYNSTRFAARHPKGYGGIEKKQMTDVFYKMFASQYLSSIDSFGSFVHTVGLSGKGAIDPGKTTKFYKYMRLAQNKTYQRNNRKSLDLTKSLYGEDTIYGDLVKRFTEMEGPSTFVIKDFSTDRNQDVYDVVTAQGQMQARLKRMESKGLITNKMYKSMLKTIKKSASGHDEGFNAVSFVSKDYFDFHMIHTGNMELIGKGSPGPKPVVSSNRVGKNGDVDTIVNKTHYFYDPKFDSFFEKNPDVQVIAFDSGAKKHRKIRKNDKDEWTDTFKSFDLNSRFSKEGKSDPLYSLLDRSELTSLNVENRSVVQASWDGTYNGTLYSGPGSAKITTPMGAFLSPAAKESYHKWARKDAVEGFSNVIHWMKPENSGKRIQDAQQNMFNITSDHKGYSGEIFSFQKIWVKAGGDPLTSWMRDTYTSYLKNKFIDEAGMLDGFTDSGGKTILRPNLDLDLDIPILRRPEGIDRDRMVIFGETKKSEYYASRPLRWRYTNYGSSQKRPSYQMEGEVFISINRKRSDGERSDVLMPLGEAIQAYRDQKNLKNVRFLDPHKQDYINTEFGTDKADIIKLVKNLSKELDKQKLDTYGKLVEHLTNFSHGIENQYNLISTGGRIPRIGIHDVLIQKIKNGTITGKGKNKVYKSSFINKEAGNVSESNMFDLALTMQADFDTDSETFYLSSPFELVRSNWENKGMIMEPKPSFDTQAPKEFDSLDMWDRDQRQKYDDSINGMSRMRGNVIKTFRLVDFFATYFPKEGIDIGDGKKLKFRNDFTSSEIGGGLEAMRRLTNDAQWVMDIYAGIYKTFSDVDSRGRSTWRERALFGNSEKMSSEWEQVSADKDKPFFYLENPKVGKEAQTRSIVRDPAMKAIIEKIITDYSQVLNIETNLWEGGYKKTPRFSDMIDTWRRFKYFYDKEYVDKNMHDHLAYDKNVNPAMLQSIFNPRYPDIKKAGKLVPGKLQVKNILRGLAISMEKRLYPLEKILESLSQQKYLEPGETNGQFPTNTLARKIETSMRADRAQDFYEMLYGREEADYSLDDANISRAVESLLKDNAKHSERIALANYLHRDITSLERRISKEREERFTNESKIKRYEAELLSKNKALNYWLEKSSTEFSYMVATSENQGAVIETLRKDSGIKLSSKYIGEVDGKRKRTYLASNVRVDKNGYLHNESKKDIWIGHIVKDPKTGYEKTERLAVLRPGQTFKNKQGENKVLPKGAFVIENPIIMHPTTSYDAIDSAALFYTIQGSKAFIEQKDIGDFRTIVMDTQSNINKILRAAKREPSPDWGNEVNPKIDAAIDGGISRIFDLARKGQDQRSLPLDKLSRGEEIYSLPSNKETYIRDYLIAILHPGHVPNINEYYSIGGRYVPALKSMRPSIFKAVFRAFETYGGEGRIPRVEELIKNLAYSHRMFSDGFMDKRSMAQAAEKIAESGWELALTAQNVTDVYNSPFGIREDRIPFREELEMLEDGSFAGEQLGKILRGQTILDPAIVLRLRNNLKSETRDAVFNRIRYQVIDGEVVRTDSKDGILIGEILGQNDFYRMSPSSLDIIGRAGKEAKRAPLDKEIQNRFCL